MITRRSVALAILMIAPLVVYLGLGAYALWHDGLFAETFWILPVCWFITWIVAIIWQPPRPSTVASQPHPPHLTPRDEQAMLIVKRYQEQVDQLTPAQLTDPLFYFHQAQALANEIARHYHPKSSDPISALTVPEVLAAARLAIDDMERWMLKAVPASHLITIKQWRWLQHAPKWLRRVQNTAWAAGVLINPANILKYLTSQATVGPISEEIQTELLAAIYLRFIRQTGFYLIEMNSGRLRQGADHYRRTFGRDIATDGEDRTPPVSVESLTIAVVGQVKAGKSSLINTLIGDRVAKSDVLPATKEVQRFQLTVPGSDVPLVLLDTPGYEDVGITKSQLNDVHRALEESDVLLFVMDAHAPARAADRKMLDELKQYFRKKPALKPPPVIICLTHIDLLSPMMEWEPPYDWKEPKRSKEQSIHDAVEHVRSLFQNDITDVVPVCTDVERNRHSQVIEELVPALLKVLDTGKMSALLRTYHADLNRGRLKAILGQLQTGGQQLLRTWLEERLPRHTSQ